MKSFSRVAGALITTGAIVVGTIMAGGAAQAAQTSVSPFSFYPEAGPYVYTLILKPEQGGSVKAYVEGQKLVEPANWLLSESAAPVSKVGGDVSTLPKVSTKHLSYYQAANVLAASRTNAGTYFGTPKALTAYYNTLAKVSATKAKAVYLRAQRIAVARADALRNGRLALAYMNNLVNTKGVNYPHAHKISVIKTVTKKLHKSSFYKGTVKFVYTFDKVVDFGGKERYVKYAVVVRDSTDRVAFQVTGNTHEGGEAYVQAAKY